MMIITKQKFIGCLIGNTFSRQDVDDEHDVDDDHNDDDADVDVDDNVDDDDCCQINKTRIAWRQDDHYDEVDDDDKNDVLQTLMWAVGTLCNKNNNNIKIMRTNVKNKNDEQNL